MAIELVPIATATATLAPPIMLPNTPAGTRVIFEIVDYLWKGERFTARQKGAAAADWLLLGAVVLVHYSGRVDGSKGLGGAPVYAAVQFETGNERYAWLNRVQAVAKGTLEGNIVVYDVYELR